MKKNIKEQKPKGVKVVEYKKGYAVELSYHGVWLNLHSIVFDFPESYYFETEGEAVKVMDKIIKIMLEDEN